MAYIALYRAYRPQKFSEVVGQRHIVKTLQNAIRLNKVAHAYLFTGPRGTGKTTMAKIVAKALNCETGIVEEPCCECDLCKEITRGTASDVVEMDAASNNSVDDIRDLIDKVKLLPSSGRYRVYIIDEVHMLTTSAFNALLKTLEEPPAHCVFILCTTDPQKVPQTILSRCQRFEFQGLTPEDVKYNIRKVAASEKIKVSDEAVDLISEACEGGMRDALSLFDQSISYSTDGTVGVDSILAVSGNINKTDIIDLINACRTSNQDEILKKINKIISEGKEIEKITSDIIGFLRDLLLYKSGFGEKAIFLNPDFQALDIIKNGIIYAWLEELNKVQQNIKFTNQKRAYLELGLLKMGDKDLNDYNELISTVKSLESRIAILESRKYEAPQQSASFTQIRQSEKPKSVIKPFVDVEVKEAPKEVVIPDVSTEISNEFIDINEVLEVLNNGDKDYKQVLRDALSVAESKNADNPLFKLMGNAIINAASQGKAIVVLDSTPICNRLMRDENYKEFLSLLRDNGAEIDDFYALPKDIFNRITKEFINKINIQGYEPNWSSIVIPVNKHKEKVVQKDELDLVVDDLFDGLEVKEEENN